MSKSHSTPTTSQSNDKPERPEGSPLFWHPSGRWCKKIRGKQHYFGRGSHEDALAEYERQADDLHGKESTETEPEGLTVYRLTTKFLTTKKHKRDAGDLSVHTFNDYAIVCKLMGKLFGRNQLVSDLGPDDFEKAKMKMAKKWGAVRLGKVINCIRVVFRYAYKNKHIDRELVFGEGFDRPSKKAIRRERQARGPKMFEADEIRAMLDKAGLPLRAMILLGVQAGLGNADVGNLPVSALDLGKGWLNYPRPKTLINRRIPLWPETVKAIREWLAVRPEAAKGEHKGLVFLTAKGDSWAKLTSDNPVSKETAKLLKGLEINGHRNFYCLRHSFQTIGDECGDFLAVRRIMGHVSNDIADEYRERISDERLRKVTDHVRNWLFAKANEAEAPEEADGPDVLPMAAKSSA